MAGRFTVSIGLQLRHHQRRGCNVGCAAYLVEGVRFTTQTAGIEPLARFVVGVGDAARAETPELRQRVQELALGALQQLRPMRKVNAKSVRLNRATD